ncbi:hypothetical protein MKX03_029493 [Papaver bracteatum]|nr:hypothetical protein MKX03_029493 [Papaver bracteatum]
MDFVTLCDQGGVEGIAASLATDLENGISNEAEDLQLRQVEYGTNTYRMESVDPPKSFFHFLCRACKDFQIILLFCCAVISLASGLKEEGKENGWYDGTTLFITIFILVTITSFRNYFGFLKSQKLQLNTNNLGGIKIIRQGLMQELFACDVVVGDLVFLSEGDWVPSDGLLVHGDNLKDDSVLYTKLTINNVQNQFLYYGAKVIHGSGYMLVTSVGINTTMGELLSKIDKMNTYLQSVGLLVELLLLLVLLIRFFKGKIDHETGYPSQINIKTSVGELMKAVERFVTESRGIFPSFRNVFAVLLVGIHEGLSLIISLYLSYLNQRILKGNQVTIRESFGATTLVDINCVGNSGNSMPVISLNNTRTIVDNLRNAGVNIKLVSAESLAVVTPIAVEYGIFLPEMDSNSIVLEGEEFRNFNDTQRREKADKIILIGSVSPSDKLLFHYTIFRNSQPKFATASLRQKGEVVAVMGTKTSEFPALKEAYVGIFMGTNNSEMAKISCDIIISTDNFAYIVDVLLVGRSNYLNIQKFLQLEVTINISAILITFATTVSLGEIPITAFQFFLVHSTVGTLAALALLTESPTQDVLEIQPSMRRNIFVQVCYQGIILLILQFVKAPDVLELTNPKVKRSMIFNSFVLCMIFNQVNARELERKKVFKGIIRSHWFLVSVGAAIIMEVLLLEFAGGVTGFQKLNSMQWLACISFAIMSWHIDYAGKCIPSFFANMFTGLPSRFSSAGFFSSV